MLTKRLLLGVCVALTPLSAFAGPSAKFAATWGGERPNVVSVAVVEDATVDTLDLDINAGYTLTTIKVPEQKELLLGVSAEVGIVTDTSIKGKNGGTARSIAGGGALVVIGAVPVGGAPAIGTVAAPGPVVLGARVQVLDATLGGVIESCTDANGDGTIDVVTECVVSDEQIGLIIGTLAAQHFNFVLPDMTAGEYDIVAWFVTGALAAVDIDEVSITEGGSVSGSAFATAFIGKHIVTVQQVRAVKGSLADTDIVEP